MVVCTVTLLTNSTCAPGVTGKSVVLLRAVVLSTSPHTSWFLSCFGWYEFEVEFLSRVDVLLGKACCLSVPGCHGAKPRNEGRFFMFLISEIVTGVNMVTKRTKIWAAVFWVIVRGTLISKLDRILV
jgi:hypothetical protein